MMKARAVCVFIIFWSTIGSVATHAQTPARLAAIQQALPTLDAIARSYAADKHLPGFIYSLVYDGNPIHTFASGVANVAAQTPVTAQSCFRIASMTKSFTAMAILKLRDEGKLHLDDPVQTYLPEMLGQRLPAKDGEAVTIRHLLTHGAGFPEDNPWGDRQLGISELQMLNMFRKGIRLPMYRG